MKQRRPPTLHPLQPQRPADAQPPRPPPTRRPPTSAPAAPQLASDPPLPSPPRRRLRVLPLLIMTVLWLLGLVLTVVLALRWLPPPTTAFMLQSPVKPVHYEWVAARHIADPMRQAVVASEDQKFFEHRGFDFEAIGDALDEHRDGGRLRGASTISQQTAKNLFLWPGGGLARKGVEAAFTVLIETLWSKSRILEVYLNVAEFGNGIYGVEAAAQAFFGKSAAHLSAAEAARLAAILPSPRRWNAGEPGPYVQERADWILRQIGRDLGVEAAEITAPDDPSVPATIIETAPAQSGDVETRALDGFDGEFGVPQPIPADQADDSATPATTPEP